MATVRFKGSEVQVAGEFPKIGSKAPDFELTDKDLRNVSLAEWTGRRKLLNIFPSIDTPVCALSTQKFNEYATQHQDTLMLMVSADLPFAMSRFCGSEGLENVVPLSTFRSESFSDNYGVRIKDGPLAGLNARAVLVLDENDTVVYGELVADIADEPNYESALAALG